MILATFRYDDKGRITAFEMEGHAGKWRPWPDMICAGVSAIGQTVIGSLQDVAGIEPVYTLEDGDIRCAVEYPGNDEQSLVIAALMASARIGCFQLEDSYGKKYVTVRDMPGEGGRQ